MLLLFEDTDFLSEPKINDFRDIALEDDVGWLDIAVNDIHVVEVVQCVNQSLDPRQCFLLRLLPILDNEILQGRTFAVLRYQVAAVVRFNELEELDDVLVLTHVPGLHLLP